MPDDDKSRPRHHNASCVGRTRLEPFGVVIEDPSFAAENADTADAADSAAPPPLRGGRAAAGAAGATGSAAAQPDPWFAAFPRGARQRQPGIPATATTEGIVRQILQTSNGQGEESQPEAAEDSGGPEGTPLDDEAARLAALAGATGPALAGATGPARAAAIRAMFESGDMQEAMSTWEAEAAAFGRTLTEQAAQLSARIAATAVVGQQRRTGGTGGASGSGGSGAGDAGGSLGAPLPSPEQQRAPSPAPRERRTASSNATLRAAMLRSGAFDDEEDWTALGRAQQGRGDGTGEEQRATFGGGVQAPAAALPPRLGREAGERNRQQEEADGGAGSLSSASSSPAADDSSSDEEEDTLLMEEGELQL